MLRGSPGTHKCCLPPRWFKYLNTFGDLGFCPSLAAANRGHPLAPPCFALAEGRHKDTWKQWDLPRRAERMGRSLGFPVFQCSLLMDKPRGCTAHIKPQSGGLCCCSSSSPLFARGKAFPHKAKPPAFPGGNPAPHKLHVGESRDAPGPAGGDGGWSWPPSSPLSAQCCGSLIRCCYLDLEGANTSWFL